MPPRHLLGAAAAVVAASTAVLGTAVTGATSDAAARPAGRHLDLVARISSYTAVDNAPDGDSAGDAVIDVFALSRGGRRVGRGLTDCRLGALTPHPLAQCSGSFRLPHGTITVAGSATDTRVTRYAVVGGTGHFAGARGVASLTPHGDQVDVALTLRGTR